MPITFGAKSVGWNRFCSSTLASRIEGLPNKQRLGVARFFAWLSNQESDPRVRRLTDLFSAAGENSIDSSYIDTLAHEREFVDIMREWRDEYLNGNEGASRVMRAQDVSFGMKGLITLRSGGCIGVPKGFLARMVEVGRERGSIWPTLGAAQWPELEGYSGIERERHALNLVRKAFLAMFLQGEELFLFGQNILRNSPSPTGADPDARNAIRASLLMFQDHVRATKTFDIDDHVTWNRTVKNPEIWIRSGAIDIRTLHDSNGYASLAHRGCLGPIGSTMMGALGVFVCDTGWNLQPTRDLPRNPYVFSSSAKNFVAERSFVESFKRRAGHHVLAYLGESTASEQSRLNVASEHWKATVEEFSAQGELDGYAVLDTAEPGSAPTSADILERYRLMAENLRDVFGDKSEKILGDGLWIYSTNRSLPRALADFKSNVGPLGGGSNFFPKDSILTRPEFSFRSIRKTWINLHRHDTGSFAATRTAAGHSSTAVLMPHYLNTPVVNAELDASIRQFQDAMEAVLVRDLDQQSVSITLGKSVNEFARLRHVAGEAGVTATLGIDDSPPELESESPSFLRFTPDEQRLLELFLLHRKLREMQCCYPNRARFRKNFLPLLALCKAIGREVFKNHLGPRYWKAARNAAADLKSGAITLPCVED